MKKTTMLSLICLAAGLCGYAQSGKYVLKVHIEQPRGTTRPSFLIVKTNGHNFIMKQADNSDYQFNLDSCFTYPQESGLSYYQDCTEEEINDLKIYGAARKPFHHMNFFITDTVSSLIVRPDTILMIAPSILQKKYWQIENELDTRIEDFNKKVGDKAHEAYNKTNIQREKDSIRNFTDELFRTNVARDNLDLTLMPAITNNLDNAISLYAMETYIIIVRALEMDIPIAKLRELLSSMPEKQKKYEIWKDLNDIVTTLKPANILTGNPAPEFTNLKDTSENPVYLKDFRGKVVFLDFWATWCGPCKRQIPALKDAYQQVRSPDVVFIGISLDYDANDWKSGIRTAGLEWKQAIDVKANNGVTSVRYNVNMIPHNFLIDRNGIVVGENIPLEDLEKEIRAVL